MPEAKQKNRFELLKDKFLNTRIGVAIAVLLVVCAAIPTLFSAVEKLYSPTNSQKSHIRLLPLYKNDRLSPLPGYPVHNTTSETPYFSDDAPAIFSKGITVRLSIRHNGIGSDVVTLTGVRLLVEQYNSTAIPELAYTVDSDQQFGAGPANVNSFNVMLDGDLEQSVYWIQPVGDGAVKAERPTGQSIKSPSTNLLAAMSQVFTLQLTENEPPEFEINVKARKSGLYTCRFVLDYDVVGSDEDYSLQSKPFRLYSK